MDCEDIDLIELVNKLKLFKTEGIKTNDFHIFSFIIYRRTSLV